MWRSGLSLLAGFSAGPTFAVRFDAADFEDGMQTENNWNECKEGIVNVMIADQGEWHITKKQFCSDVAETYAKSMRKASRGLDKCREWEDERESERMRREPERFFSEVHFEICARWGINIEPWQPLGDCLTECTNIIFAAHRSRRFKETRKQFCQGDQAFWAEKARVCGESLRAQGACGEEKVFTADEVDALKGAVCSVWNKDIADPSNLACVTSSAESFVTAAASSRKHVLAKEDLCKEENLDSWNDFTDKFRGQESECYSADTQATEEDTAAFRAKFQAAVCSSWGVEVVKAVPLGDCSTECSNAIFAAYQQEGSKWKMTGNQICDQWDDKIGGEMVNTCFKFGRGRVSRACSSLQDAKDDEEKIAQWMSVLKNAVCTVWKKDSAALAAAEKEACVTSSAKSFVTAAARSRKHVLAKEDLCQEENLDSWSDYAGNFRRQEPECHSEAADATAEDIAAFRAKFQAAVCSSWGVEVVKAVPLGDCSTECSNAIFAAYQHEGSKWKMTGNQICDQWDDKIGGELVNTCFKFGRGRVSRACSSLQDAKDDDEKIAQWMSVLKTAVCTVWKKDNAENGM
jgi:hypothetical protein